jgi:hypothetical protein
MNSQKSREITNRLQFTPAGPSVFTMPVNPDIANPPNNEGRQAIVTSRPRSGFEGSPQIDNWIEAPASGAGIVTSLDGTVSFTQGPEATSVMGTDQNGQITFSAVPTGGKYIVTVQDGQISFVLAPPGQLKLLNNSLEWTETESCE